ncbi:MAG: glycosyltransferase family 4 protein [Acidobacteria bacterium]|nr:glycosyltransferase family 4 protein [Acidobacteriota bacterium]MBI3428053.1 glycosyltransferase family 4 protein [Acidobacteriota bacterium]
MKKVLLLSNVPSPYLTPLFNKLAHDAGWKLLICYVSRWNRNVGWSETQACGYVMNGEMVLDEERQWLRRFSSQWAAALALLQKLWQQRPDYLVIYGYTRVPQLAALAWCFLTRCPFAIAGDATYYADNARGARRFFKAGWLGFIARQAAAVLVVGKASRMFWEAYGARPEQIFEALFAVDNDWFAAESRRQHAKAEAFRRQKGWQDKLVFLYVGRLIKRKNVDLLVSAVQQVRSDRAVLLIVGDGDERAGLETLAEGDPRITFVGNASQQELAFYYALAEVLVLASQTEPWGLVINEAMACGLAIIAHWQCGAAVDLVGDDNGVVLHSFTVEELTRAINELTSAQEKVRAMQACSREKIVHWSFEHAALAIRQAVELTGQPKGVAVQPSPVASDLEKTR